MRYKRHEYLFRQQNIVEYEFKAGFALTSEIIDMKCIHGDIVAILHSDSLCTYNLTGSLINSHRFRTSLGTNSCIACINDCKIAATLPDHNLIHIVTFITLTTTTDLETPAETRITGGITYRMDILYVAFSDAIRLMDLSGQIQKVISIPSVNILHYMNNDKMLCVYSKDDSDKTVSCLDCTNDSLYDFERFLSIPKMLLLMMLVILFSLKMV
ncbi:MAP3K3 [Mytilus coruscus]|uniref:MAP3K3 n=1 Tax=Mytilus coruscus TaxID=42192 RepID=A0A6J8ETL1_MYTCO|nr:MAP3K3 [Mytilus coruscus]